MLKNFNCILLTLCCAFFLTRAHAQSSGSDTAQQRLVTANMEAAFNKTVGIQSHLYKGAAYERYLKPTRGNAYFNDTTALFNGSVTYGGVIYRDVPLSYDVEQDLLISRMKDNLFLYKFDSKDVNSFDLTGHHFIRIQPANATKRVPAGFYDELYNNKLQLLAKLKKVVTKGTRGFGVPVLIYTLETNYFLKKDGIYYDVNSRGKFYDVLKDKEKELKKYLKD
ncbi:MAG: hypothetical protein H7289_13060, partial [Mucilaginibacter sp.]|nr:hypothetical protein [Mucilaginibacter sp.]